jgi:tetratricopeptide (TPR) repeat protein
MEKWQGAELDSQPDAVARPSRSGELATARALLRQGRVAAAERWCRQQLLSDPGSHDAMLLLAGICTQRGGYEAAQTLLEQCLVVAPESGATRLQYARVLSRRHQLPRALEQLELLLARTPDKSSVLMSKASVLVKLCRYESALTIYQRLLALNPGDGRAAMAYGHALKAMGQFSQAISAYRRAATVDDLFADTCWSLANLKTYRFDDGEVAAIRERLQAEDLSTADRVRLSFTLGKVYEDRGHYPESFDCYKQGNALQSALATYDPQKTRRQVQRLIASCDRETLWQAPGVGCQAPDPVFIVGLPRSGSTLLEQILASHSQVDGTRELPDILAMARKLGGANASTRPDDSRYPGILSKLTDLQLGELGAEYLERTAAQRSGAPFFIDKMPNNFLHIGLIAKILPRAKIIDARRHPMAACFSGFKQLFAKGQAFSYSLDDIGRYYQDYLELMGHWNAVLPGKVLLMEYEAMVADTEAQVRRMLDYCGLPFEAACLQFHETRRPVCTASSEQVRQPIYPAALDHWQHYDDYLGELKRALGSALPR